MDAIHGFAIDLHEGVGVLVEGNHPRLEAEPLAFADRPLVTVANIFPHPGFIERQVHGHGFRLLRLTVEPAILRAVVKIVGQAPEDGQPLGFVSGQVPMFHHAFSDHTVGNTAGSLKSGSLLGRVRQSFSSKMWISRPCAVRNGRW